MKVYRIKGTTDEVTTCDLCGRQELKGTVVLIALDADGNADGDPSYLGTSCAAKAAGWTVRETAAKVKKVKAAESAAKFREIYAARDAETKAYEAWLKVTYPEGGAAKVHGVAALWRQFRDSVAAAA